MRIPSPRVLLFLTAAVAAVAVAQDVIDFGAADRQEQDKFQQVKELFN